MEIETYFSSTHFCLFNFSVEKYLLNVSLSLFIILPFTFNDSLSFLVTHESFNASNQCNCHVYETLMQFFFGILQVLAFQRRFLIIIHSSIHILSHYFIFLFLSWIRVFLNVFIKCFVTAIPVILMWFFFFMPSRKDAQVITRHVYESLMRH